MTPSPSQKIQDPSETSRRWSRASADRAKRDVERLGDSFESAAKRVRRQSVHAAGPHVSDPEAVHDLRVAVRRLSSALRLWRPMLDTDERRAVNRALRQVRRAFGPVREIEVHIGGLEALAKERAPEGSATLAAVKDLDRVLRRRYARARTVALEVLEHRVVRRVRLHVGRACGAMDDRFATRRVRLKSAARLRDARDRARITIRAACQPGLAPDDEAFHRARIEIKKWRYTTERAAKAAGLTSKNSAGSLREMQEALGKAHDAVMLGAEIERFAARSRGRKAALAPLSNALIDQARSSIAKFRNSARRMVAGRSRRHIVPRRAA